MKGDLATSQMQVFRFTVCNKDFNLNFKINFIQQFQTHRKTTVTTFPS